MSHKELKHSKEIPLGSISKLHTTGSVYVDVIPSEVARVLVSAGSEEALQCIQVVKKGDTLVVSTEGLSEIRRNKSFWDKVLDVIRPGITPRVSLFDIKTSAKVTIYSSTINTLKASGSGSVRLRKVSHFSMKIECTGSSSIEVSGECNFLTLSVSGSGDVGCETLITRSADVTVSDSGQAGVHVTRMARLSVSGSGEIELTGNPTEVKRTIMGSGRVLVHKPL